VFRQVVAHRWAPGTDAAAADLNEPLARLDTRGISHAMPVPGRGRDAVNVPDTDRHLVRVHTLA
jgi:hypothetical protein